jgi:hypothetical protein
MTYQKRELALTGGLGNQLFQLAAALSLFNRKKFVIDGSLGMPRVNEYGQPELESFDFESDVEWVHEPRRNFDMRLYGLGVRLAVRNGKSFVYKFKLFSYKVIFFTVKLFFEKSVTFPLVISRGVGFDGGLPKILDSGYLIGYFQTFRYLQDPLVKQLLMTLRPKELSCEFIKIDSQMRLSKNIVIHIRLGDYRNEWKIGMLSPEYYRHALRSALKEMPEATLWLFSDEPNEAINLLDLEVRSRIRLIVEELSTAETFELMRNGDFYIIANSTFSWWAASLSRRPLTRVIAPQPWFVGQDSPIELIPKSWSSLDRETN